MTTGPVDEITKLRADLADEREAVRIFAEEMLNTYTGDEQPYCPTSWGRSDKFGWCDEASDAIRHNKIINDAIKKAKEKANQ